MPILGELAALGTSVLWAFNAVFFTEASRRIQVIAVSVLRLTLASILLIAVHLLAGGRFAFPLQSMIWLSISGIVALAVGDWFLFAAFAKIGPRIVLLVMTLSPVFSALIAWIFLKETLSLLSISGIMLVLAGICLVVLNKKDKERLDRRSIVSGLLMAVAASMGQGAGLVLAKQGMIEGVNVLDATMLRVLAATAVTSLYVLFAGKTKEVVGSVKDGKAMLHVSLGTTIGLIIGTLLALYAINNTKVGIGAAFISLSPVVMLPLSRIIYKERITFFAIAGTLAALAGVALILIR